MDNQPKVAPSIGVVPRTMWEARMQASRMRTLLDAMVRYLDAGVAIPEAWGEELNDLILAWPGEKENV